MDAPSLQVFKQNLGSQEGVELEGFQGPFPYYHSIIPQWSKEYICSIFLIVLIETCSFPSNSSFSMGFSSLDSAQIPDWELSVTILVSTTAFFGIGSVPEWERVGLALADRLPRKSRLTSSSSVPKEEKKDTGNLTTSIVFRYILYLKVQWIA